MNCRPEICKIKEMKASGYKTLSGQGTWHKTIIVGQHEYRITANRIYISTTNENPVNVSVKHYEQLNSNWLDTRKPTTSNYFVTNLEQLMKLEKGLV